MTAEELKRLTPEERMEYVRERAKMEEETRKNTTILSRPTIIGKLMCSDRQLKDLCDKNFGGRTVLTIADVEELTKLVRS